jgi:hypothetical protein
MSSKATISARAASVDDLAAQNTFLCPSCVIDLELQLLLLFTLA